MQLTLTIPDDADLYDIGRKLQDVHFHVKAIAEGMDSNLVSVQLNSNAFSGITLTVHLQPKAAMKPALKPAPKYVELAGLPKNGAAFDDEAPGNGDPLNHVEHGEPVG